MRRPYEHLLKLTSGDIQTVIDDLSLMQDGARIFFAVDPTEVFEYAFPVNPFDLRDKDINTIADDQAALYEVFYVSPFRPLILPEYYKELRRIHGYLTREINFAYTKTEMVSELVKRGGVEDLVKYLRIKPDSDQTIELVEEDFNIILAVVMGNVSSGIQRFGQLVRQRLVVDRLEVEGKSFRIQSVFKQYAPTPLAEKIQDELERNVGSGETPLQRERRRRADRVDALAIDRLIYLNDALEKLYIEHRDDPEAPAELRQRHVILYLSSPPKTRSIFGLKSVRDALPVIDGRPLHFWRRRDHVFAYVVHKSENKDPTARLAESIENLKQVKEVVEEIEKFGSSALTTEEGCDHCVLNDKSGENCKFRTYCEKMRQLIIWNVDETLERRRLKIQNLGLINTLDSYNRLVRKRPSGRFKDYSELFNRLYENEQIRGIATRRMQDQQWLMLTQSEFASLVSDVGLRKEPFLRANRDVITGTVQYLPTRPRVKDPTYKHILQLVVRYFKTPPQGDQNKEELFYDAFTEFLKIDNRLDGRNLEHELMRCMLYMAIPRVPEDPPKEADENEKGDKRKEGDKREEITGDMKALAHAESMLRERDLLEKEPWLESEFAYVICWAARRNRRYAVAGHWADRSISKWPGDPRFYHGRALNTYAWLNDERQSGNCSRTLEDAIRDAQDAVRLYQKELEDNRELVGANYNNLAYFWAQLYQQKPPSDRAAADAIAEARRALGQLIETIKESDWVPNHPEYLQTKAYVEFYEYTYMRSQHEPAHKLAEKLSQAKENIDNALKLFMTTTRPTTYRTLRRNINAALKRLQASQ